MKANNLKSKNGGFTLMEVMIVVAVVALIAAFAVPSYREYVKRGERADARAQMLNIANWMQQQYTLKNKYPTGSTVPTSMQKTPSTGSPKYNLSVATASDGLSSTITATPVTSDSKCGTDTLDSTGKKTVSSNDMSYCWNR